MERVEFAIIFVIILMAEMNTFSSEAIEQGWFIGRVPPGRFEYHTINGWMLPEEAAVSCEKDQKCGGFTFKGTRSHRNAVEIYFFHYINTGSKAISEYVKYPHWTSYTVSRRTYIQILGRINENANDGDEDKCVIHR